MPSKRKVGREVVRAGKLDELLSLEVLSAIVCPIDVELVILSFAVHIETKAVFSLKFLSISFGFL